jgi:uncharacterized membrane protein (DUF4010 family)
VTLDDMAVLAMSVAGMLATNEQRRAAAAVSVATW